MTIVIQDTNTRRYYGSGRLRVDEPTDALSFSDARHALQYCRRHDLHDVRLVIFFRDKKVGLLLYLPESHTLAPAGMMPVGVN